MGLCQFWPLELSSPSPKFVIGSLRDYNIIYISLPIYFVGNNCVTALLYAQVLHIVVHARKKYALSVFRIFHLRAACVSSSEVVYYYIICVTCAYCGFLLLLYIFFPRRKSCLVIFPI